MQCLGVGARAGLRPQQHGPRGNSVGPSAAFSSPHKLALPGVVGASGLLKRVVLRRARFGKLGATKVVRAQASGPAHVNAVATAPAPTTKEAEVSDSFEGDYARLDSLLRETFLQVLRDTIGPEFESAVKKAYEIADEHHQTGDENKFQELLTLLKALSPEEALLMSSAFSNLLSLHNLSEEVANAQLERLQRLGDLPRQVKSTNGTLQQLVASGVAPEHIYKTLCEQKVDLVFTAHPTQALRRSMLKNHQQIRTSLDRLNRVRLSRFEKAEALAQIRAFVQAAWRTDEIRRSAPSPRDELRGGLSYFQETIFSALPTYIRRIDSALSSIGQPRLPLDHAPVVFSSWMAGDRDGNPFVTAEVTRDAVLLCRFTAATLYFKEVESLMFELSMWRANSKLKAYAESEAAKTSTDDGAEQRLIDERKRRNYSDFWRPINSNEPYRVVLAQVRDRLYETRQVLQMELSGAPYDGVLNANPYRFTRELMEPLQMLYDSLVDTGDEAIANGHLLDLIRQVSCFGLSLVKLDIRQESERHSDVMDAITTFLGIGSYKSWNEDQRVEFLVNELQGRRPLISPKLQASPEVMEALATFRMIADLQQEDGESLGAYVISMCQSASDVLSVVLLQRECGCPEEKLLRVVPLFEKLADLENTPAVLTRLFSVPWYKEHIKGKQEVMIGYSDSGKDAGRLSAAWALYEGQEQAVEVGRKFGVDITLFHGRGGTVGRGGGPAHLGILSQPPGTVNGSLRVTIQGEIIENQFREQEMCFRSLDLYSAATLEHSLVPPVSPKPEWRALMTEMSQVACAEYRHTVFQTPEFIRYFHKATPSSELGRMNIGSRPAKRKPNAGVESLRAIPWIFAWTQTRLQLPVWLGIGSAFEDAIKRGKLATLQDMYQNWPFFKVTLDLVEMVLAKASPRIAQLYDDELLSEPELREFGAVLRRKLAETEKTVLQVSQRATLLEVQAPAGAQSLKQTLAQRAPYILPLNMLQVRYLNLEREALSGQVTDKAASGPVTGQKVPWGKELMKLNANESDLLNAIQDTLMITVKGIAEAREKALSK